MRSSTEARADRVMARSRSLGACCTALALGAMVGGSSTTGPAIDPPVAARASTPDAGSANGGTLPVAKDGEPKAVLDRRGGDSPFWVKSTSNALKGLARFGYGGIFDQSPAAAPGSLVVVQNDNDPHTGFPALAIPYGVLGQEAPLSTYKERIAVGAWKTVVCQDSAAYDIHVVGDGSGAGDNVPSWGFAYWRFRPIRDPSGRITGFRKLAGFETFGTPGGAPNAWAGANFAIWEVKDGEGNHRLLVAIEKDTTRSAVDPVDCYLGITSVAAGVAPASARDWVGLDGTSRDPTYVGRLPTMRSVGAAYVADCYAAQHALSRKVEVFFSQGNHGERGAHSRVTLTPSGTAFTVTDSNGASLTPPPSQGTPLASYNNTAGLGQSSVPGNEDDVWWLWDDGVETRLSRINSDGSVSWNPLPSLGARLTWNSFRSLSVARDGAIGIIDIPGDTLAAPVRGRIFRGTRWGDWIDMGHLANTYNYFSNPLQGQAHLGGRTWFGLMSCYAGDEPGRSQESTVAALALDPPG